MMRAKVLGGIPVPFEAVANAINGDVHCIVRLAGAESRFILTAEDARAVADSLDAAARRAAHGRA